MEDDQFQKPKTNLSLFEVLVIQTRMIDVVNGGRKQSANNFQIAERTQFL